MIRFPKLRTLAMLHPPHIHWLAGDGPEIPSTITTLQLGTLEVDLGCYELEQLSQAFPNVKVLQVLATPQVDEPRRQEYTTYTPCFSKVVELHLGTPFNFLPGALPMSNKFLVLAKFFEKTMAFPVLQRLVVEKTVEMVPTFLRKHGEGLTRLTFTSNHAEDWGDEGLEGYLPNLNTCVVRLDFRTRSTMPVPTTVKTLMVRGPILPRWRIPQSVGSCLKELILRVAERDVDSRPRIIVEKGLWDNAMKDSLFEEGMGEAQINHRSFEGNVRIA